MFTHTGTVSVVFGANEPDNDKPARKVIVDLPGGARTSFFIPEGNDPPAGSTISWGPHYAWDESRGWRVHKLTWEADPDAPLSPA